MAVHSLAILVIPEGWARFRFLLSQCCCHTAALTPPPTFSCARLTPHCSDAAARRPTSLSRRPPAAAVWRSWTGRWPPPPPFPPPPSPAAPPHAPPPECCRRLVALRRRRRSCSGWSLTQRGWNPFWTFLKTFCASLQGQRETETQFRLQDSRVSFKIINLKMFQFTPAPSHRPQTCFWGLG